MPKSSNLWIIGATVGPAAAIVVIAIAAAIICSTKYTCLLEWRRFILNLLVRFRVLKSYQKLHVQVSLFKHLFIKNDFCLITKLLYLFTYFQYLNCQCNMNVILVCRKMRRPGSGKVDTMFASPSSKPV